MLSIKNRTNHTVICEINDNAIEISANKDLVLDIFVPDDFAMKIALKINSHYEAKWWGKQTYHLVVNTIYQLESNSDESDMTIHLFEREVTHEIRYYIPLLKCDKVKVIDIDYEVSNIENIIKACDQNKKDMKRGDRIELWLSPIIVSPIKLAVLIGVGCLLTSYFGWLFALIYFPSLYLIFVAARLFGQKLAQLAFKKLISPDLLEDDIHKYLSKEYISDLLHSS